MKTNQLIGRIVVTYNKEFKTITGVHPVDKDDNLTNYNYYVSINNENIPLKIESSFIIGDLPLKVSFTDKDTLLNNLTEEQLGLVLIKWKQGERIKATKLVFDILELSYNNDVNEIVNFNNTYFDIKEMINKV